MIIKHFLSKSVKVKERWIIIFPVISNHKGY